MQLYSPKSIARIEHVKMIYSYTYASRIGVIVVLSSDPGAAVLPAPAFRILSN